MRTRQSITTTEKNRDKVKKLILTALSIFVLAAMAIATPINNDTLLINSIGKKLLDSNHLPDASFVITDTPDTFDDYFIKANTYKTVEMFTWELKDKGELTAVIAHQIGKISNNMPTQARSQAKTNTIHITKISVMNQNTFILMKN